MSLKNKFSEQNVEWSSFLLIFCIATAGVWIFYVTDYAIKVRRYRKKFNSDLAYFDKFTNIVYVIFGFIVLPIFWITSTSLAIMYPIKSIYFDDTAVFIFNISHCLTEIFFFTYIILQRNQTFIFFDNNRFIFINNKIKLDWIESIDVYKIKNRFYINYFDHQKQKVRTRFFRNKKILLYLFSFVPADKITRHRF